MTRDYYKGKHKYIKVGSDCILYHAYWDGTAVDHSSYGNDGTVVGATFIENGLSFDGSDDKVTHTPINLGKNLSAYFWAYPTAVNDAYVWAAHPTDNKDYILAIITNEFYYSCGPYVGPVAAGTILNQWHFFCVRRVGTTVQFYKDCVQLGIDQTLSEDNEHLIGTIGAYGTGSIPYKGYFGQILYFNATQSTTNQTDFYNATKARYGL
jgi:hypothetical protein